MTKVITDEKQIDEVLDRGVLIDFLPTKEEFKKRLLSGEKLRFYQGFDPTAKSLHLGHSQGLMILEDFRKLGHEVIFLIGDFTGMIGDPTDKSSARVKQTREDVDENFKGWVEQVKTIAPFDDKENPFQVKYNSEWLGKLSFADVLELASNFTVQQMLERGMFKERMSGLKGVNTLLICSHCKFKFPSRIQFGSKESFDSAKLSGNKTNCPECKKMTEMNKNDMIQSEPIYLHEFMYPLMQGYDSVAMDVDVELCGTDQIFNALAGRTLLKKLKNKEKFVVSTILIQDEKTGQLMSKSNNTGVFLDLSSNELYGAIMAQTDGMIRPLLLGCTRISLNEIDELMKLDNPRDAKMKLAFEIVKKLKGEKQAKEAEENFKTQFQKKEIPENIEEFEVKEGEGILNMLTQIGFTQSNGEARRKVTEKAVKLDDKAVEDPTYTMEKGEKIIKLGRKIAKLIIN